MKAHVLFDEKGNIHGVLVPSGIKHNKEGEQPSLTLRAQDGQRAATLEVPANLQHLKPREIHASARVEGSGGSARLVSKTR
jgi:hypothetical protein